MNQLQINNTQYSPNLSPNRHNDSFTLVYHRVKLSRFFRSRHLIGH